MDSLIAVAVGLGTAFLLTRGAHAQTITATEAVGPAESLPYPLENARRAPWGTILMGMPTVEHSADRDRNRPEELARELRNQGIEVVFSFAEPQPLFAQAIRNQGIVFAQDFYPEVDPDLWNFHGFLGSEIPWYDGLLTIVENFGPDRVAIHCTHGVDRTGNAAAFLMSVLYGVPIEDAWYAMVSDSRSSVAGVAQVLSEYGINDVRDSSDPSVHIWPENSMKGHSSGFRRYMRCTIDAALARGAHFRSSTWHYRQHSSEGSDDCGGDYTDGRWRFEGHG